MPHPASLRALGAARRRLRAARRPMRCAWPPTAGARSSTPHCPRRRTPARRPRARLAAPSCRSRSAIRPPAPSCPTSTSPSGAGRACAVALDGPSECCADRGAGARHPVASRRPSPTRSGRDRLRRRPPASTRAPSRRCARSTICRRCSSDALELGPRRLSRRTTPRRSSWCLSRPSLRDIALVQWSSDLDGRRRGARRAAALGGGRGVSRRTSRCDCGARANSPTRRDSSGRCSSSRHVAAAAPRPPAPGRSRCARGCRGRSGARRTPRSTPDEACEIEPEHGLGEIVLSFVHAGHLPDWAFRRPVTPTGRRRRPRCRGDGAT